LETGFWQLQPEAVKQQHPVNPRQTDISYVQFKRLLKTFLIEHEITVHCDALCLTAKVCLVKIFLLTCTSRPVLLKLMNFKLVAGFGFAYDDTMAVACLQ